jgi:N4-gp56 family major capsid protein
MAKTVVGLNDAKAVKKWSGALAVATAEKSYWTRKMMGNEGSSMPIIIKTELEREAGEQISYDMVIQLKGQGVEGDNVLKGNEEALTMYTATVFIDQKRHAVDTGGAMTRKRTLHNLRNVAKDRLSDWWARYYDEQFFIYLSGARGVATGLITPTDFTGRANNSLAAPDTKHLLYGGNATAKANVDSGDKMDLAVIDKCVTKADTLGGDSTDYAKIQPIMVNGEEHFVMVMHPFQEYDLRTNTSTGQWLDIQKAAASAEGNKNPIFKGSMGMYNNVLLHKHKQVIRFSDYGAGQNVAAARALFLGEQAGVIAFGSGDKVMRFSWEEEMTDYGNNLGVAAGSIFGVRKNTFNSLDFGVVSVDTAAADPNP